MKLREYISDKRGMTLIELLIAMTIIVITVFAFTPLITLNYTMLAQAGQSNTNLYNDIGEIEGEIAEKIESGVGNTDGIVVSFPIGVGTTPTLHIDATGEFIEPTTPSAGNENMTAFLGESGTVEGGLILDPARLQTGDFPDAAKGEFVLITAVGFEFKDVNRFSIKINTNDADSDVSDFVTFSIDPSDPTKAKMFFDKNHTIGTGSNTKTFDDIFSSANAPFRVFYGNYFAYQNLDFIPFETFDYIVGGESAHIAVAEDIKTSENGNYIWMYEAQLPDTKTDAPRSINDILWVPGHQHFAGLGDDGLYFEISANSPLVFLEDLALSDSTMNKIGGDSYTYTLDPSADIHGWYDNAERDFVDALVSPFDSSKKSIDFVGGLAVWAYMKTYDSWWGSLFDEYDWVWVADSGQYNFDRSRTPTMYASVSSSDDGDNDETGNIFGSSMEGIAAGTMSSSEDYTLFITESNRIYYRKNYYDDSNMVNYQPMINRNYRNDRYYNFSQGDLNAIAYGGGNFSTSSGMYSNGYFVVGTTNGKLYRITDPDAVPSGRNSSSPGISAATLNASNSNKFNAIAYGSKRWVAVGDNGTIFTSQNGTSWSKENSVPTLKHHDGVTISSKGTDFTDIAYVPYDAANPEAGGEFFVVGTNSAILHIDVNSSGGFTNTWVLDTVYQQYDPTNPANQVPYEGWLTLNTIAKKEG